MKSEKNKSKATHILVAILILIVAVAIVGVAISSPYWSANENALAIEPFHGTLIPRKGAVYIYQQEKGFATYDDLAEWDYMIHLSKSLLNEDYKSGTPACDLANWTVEIYADNGLIEYNGATEKSITIVGKPLKRIYWEPCKYTIKSDGTYEMYDYVTEDYINVIWRYGDEIKMYSIIAVDWIKDENGGNAMHYARFVSEMYIPYKDSNGNSQSISEDQTRALIEEAKRADVHLH